MGLEDFSCCTLSLCPGMLTNPEFDTREPTHCDLANVLDSRSSTANVQASDENTPKEIRTPVADMKSRCPSPLDDGGGHVNGRGVWGSGPRGVNWGRRRRLRVKKYRPNLQVVGLD